MSNTHNTQKHTPGEVFIDEQINKTEIVIGTAKNYALCTLYSDPMDEETKANAARIVQCWNGWDELQAEKDKYVEVANANAKDALKLKAENEALRKQVEVLRALESNFYMDICRAYNAGKQSMNNQHQDAREGKEFNERFVSSHDYFINEFPEFTTNVP